MGAQLAVAEDERDVHPQLFVVKRFDDGDALTVTRALLVGHRLSSVAHRLGGGGSKGAVI